MTCLCSGHLQEFLQSLYRPLLFQMPSVAQLFTLLTIAAISSATVVDPIIARAAKAGHCPSPNVTHQETIDVGGKSITHTTLSCAHADTHNYGSRALLATDVCGESCSKECNNDAGSLPPVVEDCNKIVNSVAVLASNIAPTFTVSGHGAKILTFNTCSFIFTNRVSTTLQECWTHMVTMASQAGAGCFPPVQPFFSEGLCTGGTWSVAAARSS